MMIGGLLFALMATEPVHRSPSEQAGLFLLVMLLLYGAAQWFMPRHKPSRGAAR